MSFMLSSISFSSTSICDNMKQLSKIVSRQDANFKLSPSSSNETSINLSNEISDFVSDKSGEVSFIIYKDDFIKALGALCNFPKLFSRKESAPVKPVDIFTDLSSQIIAEFENADSSIYTVNLLKRDDGRSYFNNLKKPNGFNLRSFLVERYSELIFEKRDDDSIVIRLKTSCESMEPNEETRKKIKEMLKTAEECNKEPLQRIYYGAPGTGKSYTIDNLTDETNSVRTTFHPDSDYASFVGAYKPTMEAVPLSAFVGTSVQYAESKNGHPGTERKIVYKYVPQAFLKAYVAAWSNLDEPFYLVIEEINRGNCAQIFGDLFQLLDRNNHGSSSYAIAADEDIAQFLSDDKKGFAGLSDEQREAIRNFKLIKDNGKEVAIGPSILNGTKLLLPPNLRIWATMNTSDQSLFPIDSAFKRRWDWKYVPIEYNKMNWMLEVGGKRYSWGVFLEKINPEIYALTESADKQMGYFFAKPDKKSNPILTENDIISEEVFLNKVLFYLWTDVLKDYDLTKEPFVYEGEDKKKKAFRFTDFFPLPNNPNLNKFVAGLGLTIIGEAPDDTSVTFDSEGDAELNTSQTESVRDYSKYSVNGTGSYTKSDAVVEVVKALVASMPTANANEVLDKIKSFGLSYTLVYNEKDYKYYFDRSTDSRFEKRYAEITLANGDKIYVYRGSTPERIGELVNGLANTGTGISLARIE